MIHEPATYSLKKKCSNLHTAGHSTIAKSPLNFQKTFAMKKLILLVTIAATAQTACPQNVGIGTATPHASALLHVDLGASTSAGLLVTGTFNASSSVPNLSAGTRLMFYPAK